MSTVPVYNQQGSVISQQQLRDDVFGVAVKPTVIAAVVTAHLANSRQVVADTKDRSEVRGGGKKPWRQKGTGRARHGSSRSPIWRGGGITFGPTTQRNFTQKVNKKVKQQAMRMVLSVVVADDRLLLVDTLDTAEIKTKQFYTMLQRLQLRPSKKLVTDKSKKEKDATSVTRDNASTKVKNILVVMSQQQDTVYRSARNIARVTTIGVGSLNIFDILNHHVILASTEAIQKIEAKLAK